MHPTLLSTQETAEYPMPGFAGVSDLSLTLSRAELAQVLAEPLGGLQRTCREFTASLSQPPQHLVLVGRPMLSPLVREVVERVFNIKRTAVTDPRTAVACGASLLAAMYGHELKDELLLDVTPLPLGIRIKGERFSELIARNTKIPTSRSGEYTTAVDNQSVVNIEIFNGALDPESKIGGFLLAGIPPAAQGVPKIEVSFDIDASCVLAVTARDKGTGQVKSIRIEDTTLLTPAEVAGMAARYEQQLDREHQQHTLEGIRQRLRELITDAGADDTEAAWREFRSRQVRHRPTSARVDADTQQTLVQMFGGAHQMEANLASARRSVRDAAARAQEYVDGSSDDIAEGERLVAEFDERCDVLQAHAATVAVWNAVLVRLALMEPDPLLRLRNQHDVGEYHQALQTIGELSAPLEDPTDVGRLLHCLAEIGDADKYREVLTANRERLRVASNHTEGFVVRVGAGAGFLIDERLVVTNRRWLIDDQVRTCAGAKVEQVYLPDSPHTDIALLRLAEPAAGIPLRLGYPTLMRIGDRVWVDGPQHGIVDKFESFPEHAVHLVKVSLSIPPSGSGGPLRNDLGEVVGILTVNPDQAATEAWAYALTVDVLDPLLAEAGFDRYS